jgi:hypothetical protein
MERRYSHQYAHGITTIGKKKYVTNDDYVILVVGLPFPLTVAPCAPMCHADIMTPSDKLRPQADFTQRCCHLLMARI